MDHASALSKISMTSSRRGVRCGARGTAILSDLHTDGGVVVLVPSTEGGSCWRRRGKVGVIWGAQVGACSSCHGMHGTEDMGKSRLRAGAPE